MSTDNHTRGRMVAIVGRPNVGKSALFNRLAGQRIAIVHRQSGVTRDRLMREITWNDRRFELIDTGGVCTIDDARSPDRIEAGIRAQVDAALADASVAIFVVDVETGVLPLDREVAGLLHNSGCAAVVAVNKADNPERDPAATDFNVLGFETFPVSALHNRGFDPLMEAVLGALPEGGDAVEQAPLRVAVVGRPNVGKSSYINRLLRSDRVIVSEVPGTTRDSIDIPFTVGNGPQARHYILTDTAGLRRGGKVRDAVEKFSAIRARESMAHCDIAVLVLDASGDGPTAQDKKVAAAVLEEEKGCVVLVNKWDLSERTQRKYAPELLRVAPFLGYCPIVFVSSKTGYNIRRSIEAIDHVAAQVRVELPTSTLNRVLEDATARVNAPVVGGRPLKVYYAAQVGQAPVRIRIFVNKPRDIPKNYRTYLERSLRENFGLEGAPIVLQFRPRHQRKD